MPDHRGRLLIVDDDAIILDSLKAFLHAEGFDAHGAATARESIDILKETDIDIVLTDVNLPDADGFELLRRIRQRRDDLIVIMMTGYGTIESAVEAIRMGAYDYLTKPIIDDELRLVVQRAMEQRALVRQCQTLRDQLDERYGLDGVIGHDYRMRRVFDLVEAVSRSSANVLIEGASGVGKSMIARVIHHRSDRRDEPFVELSCGALPESLLESELFGHVKGAFTGAVADKPGKFQAANGGTLFLDEISSASPALQSRLLRVVQERAFEPVGSNRTQTVDTRLIVASNVDLESEVAAGRFRQDLFYRVNVVTIPVPNLRDRIGDIPLLAERFLKSFSEASGRRLLGVTDEAMRRLQAYHWPGNVRELENVIERAVVLTRNPRIEVRDLPAKLVTAAAEPPDADIDDNPLALKDALAGPERRAIIAALRRHHGCRQRAADELEINRTTLYKKMKKYGLLNEAVEVGL
jgi:DNA-binding NtrC family response regulator